MVMKMLIKADCNKNGYDSRIKKMFCHQGYLPELVRLIMSVFGEKTDLLVVPGKINNYINTYGRTSARTIIVPA